MEMILDGGPFNGLVVLTNGPMVICLPVKNGEQWVTAVYHPEKHGERSVGVYNRTIKWADNAGVTPIDKTLADALVAATPEAGTILELGSGTSTYWLLKKRRVVSIENDYQFYGRINHWSRTIFCPLGGDKFYNGDVLRDMLAGLEYNTVLVDGPDAPSRLVGWIDHCDLFAGVDTFFDDYALGEYQAHMHKYANMLGKELEIHNDCAKPWAVVRGAA